MFRLKLQQKATALQSNNNYSLYMWHIFCLYFMRRIRLTGVKDQGHRGDFFLLLIPGERFRYSLVENPIISRDFFICIWLCYQIYLKDALLQITFLPALNITTTKCHMSIFHQFTSHIKYALW